MRLLLTADLHYRIHWFRWLIEEASNFDLVCIAGDLLDMFRFETRTEQSREIANLGRLRSSSESWQTAFPSHFVPAITTTLADLSRMTGRRSTSG
jgi:Icc-related predicted phosphoesterase